MPFSFFVFLCECAWSSSDTCVICDTSGPVSLSMRRPGPILEQRRRSGLCPIPLPCEICGCVFGSLTLTSQTGLRLFPRGESQQDVCVLMIWCEEDTIHPRDALQTSMGLADLAARRRGSEKKPRPPTVEFFDGIARHNTPYVQKTRGNIETTLPGVFGCRTSFLLCGEASGVGGPAVRTQQPSTFGQCGCGSKGIGRMKKRRD